MKLYRVQLRYKDLYFDEIVEADNDKDALVIFSNGIESETFVGADESFYGDRVYITFEEVDRNVITGASVEKTTVGVQVGKPSIISGESNT